MRRRGLASAVALCIVLAACSRQDSVFSMSPAFRARTAATASSVEACIASRWKSGTRNFSLVRQDGAIRLRAQTFFTGVTIGVSVRKDAGKTLVEFFQRRIADPLYGTMVRGCLHPGD